ncbi:hypothetical protein FQA39_LY18509 [Lamprigera yunnana]|nr:hypothetical protein FQA39_LY18509 [Lamprigera yunnana]
MLRLSLSKSWLDWTTACCAMDGNRIDDIKAYFATVDPTGQLYELINTLSVEGLEQCMRVTKRKMDQLFSDNESSSEDEQPPTTDLALPTTSQGPTEIPRKRKRGEEEEEEEISLDDSSGDATYWIPKVEPSAFEELNRDREPDDFELVQFKAKNNVFYVGKVLKLKKDTNDIEVNFLRKSVKF